MTYTSPAPRTDSRQRARLRASFRTGIITLTGRLTARSICGESAARTVDSGSLQKRAAISCIFFGSYCAHLTGTQVSENVVGSAQVCTLQLLPPHLFFARGVHREPSPAKRRSCFF